MSRKDQITFAIISALVLIVSIAANIQSLNAKSIAALSFFYSAGILICYKVANEAGAFWFARTPEIAKGNLGLKYLLFKLGIITTGVAFCGFWKSHW